MPHCHHHDPSSPACPCEKKCKALTTKPPVHSCKTKEPECGATWQCSHSTDNPPTVTKAVPLMQNAVERPFDHNRGGPSKWSRFGYGNKPWKPRRDGPYRRPPPQQSQSSSKTEGPIKAPAPDSQKMLTELLTEVHGCSEKIEMLAKNVGEFFDYVHAVIEAGADEEKKEREQKKEKEKGKPKEEKEKQKEKGDETGTKE